MWKCLKLQIYCPTPKWNRQQGLNKLRLTFLDEAIDKNRLAICSARANLSRVLAHLKWIFHFLPDAGVSSKQDCISVDAILLCPWAGISRFPRCCTRELIVSQRQSFGSFPDSLWRTSLSSLHISAIGWSAKETKSVQQHELLLLKHRKVLPIFLFYINLHNYVK